MGPTRKAKPCPRVSFLKESPVIVFYREKSGDYLAIDTASNDYYRRMLGKDQYEGRATAIAKQVGSVCTTGISRGFLRQHCKRVARAKVPAKWRQAIGLD
jgi:hypothetical protein